MIFKVIAKSSIGEGIEVSDIASRNLSGFSANICYSDGYDADSIDGRLANVGANISRFDRVIDTLHHSISDHPMATVYLGGISKMLAMVLNSLGFYATSERSARYTDVSKSASEKEAYLYNKWRDIFVKLISDKYPSISESRRLKLAMENARYFISVLNPSTSMEYTTSFRQWSYIAQWFEKFYSVHKDSDEYFIRTLANEMHVVSEEILKNHVGTLDIEDMKNRSIRFLARQTDDIVLDADCSYEYSYHVRYECSLACLAQAQRHRTLRYFMDFDPAREIVPYVPTMIQNDESLLNEWVSDMKEVAHLIPQGTTVVVHEEGNVYDFRLKCMERLCGRAQLEIAKLTEDTLFEIYTETCDESVADFLDDMLYTSEDSFGETHIRAKAKCELMGSCKEPCEFGPYEALSREI